MEHFREPVKTDCEELLARFQATESVRYEQFLEVWRDMNFSSIFYGKPEPSERRRFARLILSVVSPYFFPPYTFQIRVGGLFLLYGLFNSQLVTPREKIRISLKDWKDVMQFQRDAVNAQHYDVVYIFRKLLTDKAFYFTAMPIPLFYREKKEDGRKMKICEEFVDPSSRPQELVTTDMLEEIANIHEHYEGLKKSVFAEPDPNLDLIQKNLVPKLNGAILTYSSWQWNRTDSEQQDGGEGPSNQESSRRAQLLASIKSKSYGQAVEASKSRRHRQTQLAPAAEAEFSQKVTSKKKRKPSLKTRTQYLFNTQGNESEGLNVTRVWCMSAVKEEKAPEKRKKKFNWNPEKSSDPT
ncbi:snRNA-activating protein complex subunit 1b isoform X2 [Megalobrama amblycephala]|uniref:snRNA-activating protein complex subunit 1b isoform X2 n=1 Tax=Megalobrama amblycephala TaxID=75352 RepID=UPI002014397F|nr:snRNA-activating protein complex subunit 1b isoform X2 [Megalobrama amblycephala]